MYAKLLPIISYLLCVNLRETKGFECADYMACPDKHLAKYLINVYIPLNTTSICLYRTCFITSIIYVAIYKKNQFHSHILITSLILFQSQSPLSLLFEIDMDKLTEHQTMKVMFMVDMIVFNTRLSLRVVD